VALVLAFLLAVVLAPVLTRALAASSLARTNHRGARIAAPLGLLILVPALPFLSIDPFVMFAVGVAALGFVDDLAAGPVRGVRAHVGSVLAGHPDTGALKAAGTAALAAVTLRWQGLGGIRLVLAIGVLVLAAHSFNLLDLRPGRAIKAFALLAIALLGVAASLRPLLALEPFLGPIAVVAVYDLRERGMLGDTGASLLGALAGLLAVATLPTAGLAIALAGLLAVAVYGELRSISALIAGVPLLRCLDSVGRPA
jgi:UDP-GlcNAc:undecaprenyl-phosphate GlcNAc-1-phosphate transferase